MEKTEDPPAFLTASPIHLRKTAQAPFNGYQ
jgi:hypothetical protein